MSFESMAIFGSFILAVLIAACGFIAWLFKINTKPMQIALDNNTAAMKEMTQSIFKINQAINDHEVRLVEIETTHNILDCKNNKRG
jgi:hypothetical protein